MGNDFKCFNFSSQSRIVLDTVKLLLRDQLRDHQKAVAEEKGSPNAIKVKPTDNIYYTLTTHYFRHNLVFLVLI